MAQLKPEQWAIKLLEEHGYAFQASFDSMLEITKTRRLSEKYKRKAAYYLVICSRPDMYAALLEACCGDESPIDVFNQWADDCNYPEAFRAMIHAQLRKN